MTSKVRINHRVGEPPAARNFLALFVALSVGAQSLLTVLVLILLVINWRALNAPAPSQVQLLNGKSIETASVPAHQRQPETVRLFVSDSLVSLLTWSGKLPAPVDPTGMNAAPSTKDTGVAIRTPKGEMKVSTLAWQASFTLSEDFRKQFLVTLATTMPQGVFEGNTEVILIPQNISDPQKISEGQWKVQVVANLVIRFGSEERSIPFNKEVFVRTVDFPPPPENQSPIASTIYAIRLSGLEITNMRDLATQNYGS